MQWNECCCFGIDGYPKYTGVEITVYGSGDIRDVLVKAEYRVHSDSEVLP